MLLPFHKWEARDELCRAGEQWVLIWMQKVCFQGPRSNPLCRLLLAPHCLLVMGTSLLSFRKVMANNCSVMIAHTCFDLNSVRQEYESTNYPWAYTDLRIFFFLFKFSEASSHQLAWAEGPVTCLQGDPVSLWFCFFKDSFWHAQLNGTGTVLRVKFSAEQ